MKKNISMHDVSIQINGNNNTEDSFDRTESKFIKSDSHLKSLIYEIENSNKSTTMKDSNLNSTPKLNTQANTTLHTRNGTKDNLNTEVVEKRKPGRPKSDPATKLNNQLIKHKSNNPNDKISNGGDDNKNKNDKIKSEPNDLNGIIKEEISNNPNTKVI